MPSETARGLFISPVGFDVDELVQPEFGQFAPVTGIFDSAERQAQIAAGMAVDKHRSRLYFSANRQARSVSAV